MICAGVDIGTNTILMVIGEQCADGSWRIIEDLHEIGRLGEGVDATGRISNEAIERAIVILSAYRERCIHHGVERLRAVATSAMRDAANSDDVRRILCNVIATEIEVIDGGEEARLTFRGTVRGPQSSIAIDIGGGSTELVCGASGSVSDAVSLEIGAVRFTERYFSTRPPSEHTLADARSAIAATVAPFANRFLSLNNDVVAAAGTPTALATLDLGLDAFDASKIHGHVLTASVVHQLMLMLVSLDTASLRRLPAIHPKRIDILPAGALILDGLMNSLLIDSLIVSTGGVRYGVLYSLGTEQLM